MPLLPPAEVVREPLPKQIWATLKEARRAATKNERSLVVFVPEDKARFDAAVAFFKSVEGVKARKEAEVWLPNPGDPDATRLMDELGLRSLPALVSLSNSGKRSLKSRMGEDCVPLSDAFEELFESKPVPLSWVRGWVGSGQPVEPFLAFAKDRKQSLDAGAKEPHRTWLMGLLEGDDKRLRNWAATRLVEANAPLQAKESKPFPVLVELLQKRFEKEVRQGNQDRENGIVILPEDPKEHSFTGYPNPPMMELGLPGIIPDKAPLWPALRELLKSNPAMKVSVPIYVLMAPALQEADRDWLHVLLSREAKEEKSWDAQRATLYWIATDWLLAFGKASDWEAFRVKMAPMGWDESLVRLMEEVKKVPGYWDSEPGLQSMFCEGETQESFWEHPDACLASWGVTREALVEFGMDKMKSKGTPAPPEYPGEAYRRGFSTTLHLRMIVGPDGNTKWVRPEPGYALSFFAPAGMAYAMKWRFEPARVAGVPRPSQFRLNMPFRRTR